MIIAAAQTAPKRENIKANLQDHVRFVEKAAKHRADLIIFPELSLTSYERELAVNHAFTLNDSRLLPLRELSTKHNMVISAGAPVLINGKLYIGAFIIKPDNTIDIYTKQYLHTGEDVVFSSSFNYNPRIKFGDDKVLFAICADINNPKHPHDAKNLGATLYAAGIFWEPDDMPRAFNTLSGYARTHSMNVIMANFVGKPWDSIGGGSSAFWDKNGKLIAQLNTTDEGLLIIEKTNAGWVEKK